MAVLLAFITLATDGLPFPGAIAAIPAISAAMILVSGAGHAAVAPAAMLRLAPFQWLGRHSYAIYLWHWPVAVFGAVLDPSGSPIGRLAGGALTLALSAISQQVLENPVRSSRWLAASRGARSRWGPR